MMGRIRFALLSCAAFVAISAFAVGPPENPGSSANPGQAGLKQYIVVFNSANGQPITDTDVQKAGGRVDVRRDDHMIVSLPDHAVAAIRAHNRVKYMQVTVTGPQPLALPGGAPLQGSTPPPGVAFDALRTALPTIPNTAAPTWTSGLYNYDAAGNLYALSAPSASSTYMSVYRYDAASRLVGANLSTPNITRSITYTYDAYGNQLTGNETGATRTRTFDAATNHLSGTFYDQAGNQLSDDAGPHTYDALNMATAAYDTGGTAKLFAYTASDERVFQMRQGTTWFTMRDFEGRDIREFRVEIQDVAYPWLWLADSIHRDGVPLASQRQPEEGGLRHLHVDHLGTPRLVTGDLNQKIAEHEYAPFGMELTSLNQEVPRGYGREDHIKFTGHERDFASGPSSASADAEDYMHARYYRTPFARFMSVDPVLDAQMALRNPQGWNRYAYVMNNPIAHNDPNGRETNPVTGKSGIDDSEVLNSATNPIKGHYGYVRDGGAKFHSGVDIAAPRGTPIFAPISGTVQTGSSAEGGFFLRITQKKGGHTIVVHMSHLNKLPTLKNGSKVLEGQPGIAEVGNTGNAKNEPPHVHTTVLVDGNDRKKDTKDPQDWFATHPSDNAYQRQQCAPGNCGSPNHQ